MTAPLSTDPNCQNEPEGPMLEHQLIDIFTHRLACVAGRFFGRLFLFWFVRVRDSATQKLNQGRKRKQWGRG